MVNVGLNQKCLDFLIVNQTLKASKIIFCGVFLFFPAFNLDFFTDVLDMSYLLQSFNTNPFLNKFKKLNQALTDVVQDYSLVSFSTLYVEVSLQQLFYLFFSILLNYMTARFDHLYAFR